LGESKARKRAQAELLAGILSTDMRGRAPQSRGSKAGICGRAHALGVAERQDWNRGELVPVRVEQAEQ
jgi:hypothetical protein